ncbi:MAG: fibronectin type III domain-containing protein [Betaproteobacteria bacterium]
MLVTKEFWARPGTAWLPGGISVPFWGLSSDPGAEPQLPGPVIEAVVGDTVEITLHNTLAEPVSLLLAGQGVPPEPVLDGAGRLVSLVRVAPPGGSAVYRFAATRPGTFRYESGTSPERQVQMGLYGALIVRPVGYADPGHPAYHTAYGPETTSTYDTEALLLISELDPAAHTAIAAGEPYDLLTYAPRYWLLNGRPFPDCTAPADFSGQPLSARLRARTGERLLLRVVNAGFLAHTLALPGAGGRLVGEDGWPLRTPELDGTYERTAVTLGPGKTCDLLLTPPDGRHVLYGRELLTLANVDETPGGLLTLLEVRPAFPETAPAAPSDLRVTVTGTGRADLAWTNNSADEDGFLVERRTGAFGEFQRIATLPEEASGWSDPTLSAEGAYTYRVLAFNAAGLSSPSNEVTVVLQSAQPPEAPSALTATAISPYSIVLTWQDNSSTEEGFRIERRTEAERHFVEVGTTAANVTLYTDTGLAPRTRYTYRVRAFNAAGYSDYSGRAYARTPAGAVPAAPSNLSVSAADCRRTVLIWTDNSRDEYGFIVERSLAPDGPFTQVDWLGPNVTYYVDRHGLGCIPLYYRVRAYNAYGVSPPSNTASSW